MAVPRLDLPFFAHVFPANAMSAQVTAVSLSPGHTFHKANQQRIRLLEGLGVEGDAHLGKTVKHRSRLLHFGSTPNLRQVHLVHAELHDELRGAGFVVQPGEIGENVTTRGVDLLALPTGARLRLGADAVVELTGLRNPCSQLDRFQKGLMKAVLGRDAEGNLVRKSGVMAVVVRGGEVAPGDGVEVELPPEPHRPLQPV
jgi:MOSC domain-containing protein YiiM